MTICSTEPANYNYVLIFRSKHKDLSINASKFDIDCLDAYLEKASKAKEQFIASQDNYSKQPDEPCYSHVAGDTPSMMGEVALYILVIKLFFLTVSFKSEESQKCLLRFLKEPTSEKFREILKCKNLQEEQLVMVRKKHESLLNELYSRTKSRLTAATRKMALSCIRMDILEKNADDFSKFFGEDIFKIEWTKIVNSKRMNRSQKIEELEGLLLPVCINNFIRTVAREVKFLSNWMKILEKIESELDPKIVSADSALCYVTIYMAVIFNNFHNISLKQETADRLIGQLVAHLIDERHDIHSEIVDLCNFYLMLHWPAFGRRLEDEAMFMKCLNLLQKRQSELKVEWFQLCTFGNEKIGKKSATKDHQKNALKLLFQVQVRRETRKEEWSNHLGSMKDAGINKKNYILSEGAEKFTGRLKGNEVTFKPKGISNPINLRAATRIKKNHIDVTFIVVFTAIGPLACNIEEVD